jgi:hypothetical protein
LVATFSFTVSAMDEPQKKGKTRYNIGAEEFCVIWTRAETYADAVRAINALLQTRGGPLMSEKIIQARASYYRTIGVKLKRFRDRPSGLGYEQADRLNQIIDDVEAGRDPKVED